MIVTVTERDGMAADPWCLCGQVSCLHEVDAQRGQAEAVSGGSQLRQSVEAVRPIDPSWRG